MKIIEKRLQNKDKKIVFSGPPGVGKTTIGRIFAKKVNSDFYDLDDFIADKLELKTSKEVIEKFGRDFFREKESFYLEELLRIDERIVISVGGGTNSKSDNQYVIGNIDSINKCCFNICILPSDNIDEAIEILYSRLDNERRAMVTDKDGLYERWKIHTPFLIEQADIVVYIYNERPESIVEEIIKRYHRQ